MFILENSYLTAVLFVFLFMTLVWFWGKQRNNYAVIDVGWGIVIAGISAVFSFYGKGSVFAKFAVLIPILIWALRLSGFLYWTRIKTGHPEDKRYADFRKNYGKDVHRKFFTNVFLLQGFLAFFLSFPSLVAADWQASWTEGFPLSVSLGWFLFLLGLMGETIADKQLHSFISNPTHKGKVCDVGLWKYTRHPNYFFEWVIWLGIAVIPLGAGTWSLVSLITPLFMFVLLRFVSGVPFAEKYSLLSKGDSFREYQKTTNAFFPWFPGTWISSFSLNSLLEKDIFPDWLIRIRIRQLLSLRLKQETKANEELQLSHKIDYVKELKRSPIAVHTTAANEQHYEVPSDFFTYVMGPRMKYSSGYWPESDTGFAESEEIMLKLTVERAELKDGMKVLDLGCGWGSISLYVAEKFPKCKVTGVSNSKTQKLFIEARAKERGLNNLTILTQDMNDFTISEKFDRIISVEMLEHMKNYEKLFEKLSTFLNSDGKFFVHIFTHKKFAYPFEVVDDTDWMAKYFFTGGQMPSDDLFLYFQKDFLIEDHWIVNGTHYARTSEAWYDHLLKNKEKVMEILAATYGEKEKTKWFVYWKVFFLACAELWAYRNGEEWLVSHYLFRKRGGLVPPLE